MVAYGASQGCVRSVNPSMQANLGLTMFYRFPLLGSHTSFTTRNYLTNRIVISIHRLRGMYSFIPRNLTYLTLPGRTQAIFRFVDGTSRGSSSSILSHFDRSAHRPPGLVKQAYSAYVTPAHGARTRKWHLTAYFTYADLQNLPTIDVDPNLRNMQVPPGVYRSGKARTRNSDMSVDTSPRMSSGGSTASSSPPSTPRRTGMSSPSVSNYPELAISPRFLPPLHTAVPHGNSGVAPRIASPQRETRCSEDQRVIQMLNSRSDR